MKRKMLFSNMAAFLLMMAPVMAFRGCSGFFGEPELPNYFNK